VRLLLLSLLITPLRKLAQMAEADRVRRMVGRRRLRLRLRAFLSLHRRPEIRSPARRLGDRAAFYLTIGFRRAVGADFARVTSTDFMIRRMGPRWNRLHKTVYILAALAFVPLLLQSKADVSDPVMMTASSSC